MSVNANPNNSTMAPAAIVPMEKLPAVQVYQEDGDVVVKWDDQETIAGLSNKCTDFAHAVASNGVEPLCKTFGTLIHLDGDTLTIGDSKYRIHTQHRPEVGHRPEKFAKTEDDSSVKEFIKQQTK
jgi:hypothetical protein